MNRRNFLRNSSLTGVTLGAAALESFLGAGRKNVDRDAGIDGFALEESTIDQLQQKMKSGEYTSQSITEMYLQRIAAVDKNGPVLNAIIELNPDAREIAARMDAERKAGKIRGLLHGIPILVKDNINTGDKMMTTAGSLALEGHKAGKDAFIVKQLREAGAVLLGKTNLSEWANFRSSRSTSGWSSRGGQTKNPYRLTRNPSGSSAGSGSAVSGNLCVVAVGTETNGSVVSPASVNGLVGIKPTVGLVSRSGIIPISKTQDTAGPMARTVRDAAILLGVLAGVDEQDDISLQSKGKGQSDYTPYLDPNGLSGKRIGVEKSYLNGHEGVVGLYQEAIATMKAQGATVIEVELVKLLNDAGSVEGVVLQYEFKDGLNRYLAGTSARAGAGTRAGAATGEWAGVKSLADIIVFNKQNEKKAMPYFKQETLERSEARGGLDSQEYIDALKKLLGARTIIDDLMKQEHLDAISATTNGLACCIDLINGDYRTGFSFSSPAAMAGYPHITVPMGMYMGLPVGISFIGGAYAEPGLLKIAYAYEQASRKRVAPMFVDEASGLA